MNISYMYQSLLALFPGPFQYHATPRAYYYKPMATLKTVRTQEPGEEAATALNFIG